MKIIIYYWLSKKPIWPLDVSTIQLYMLWKYLKLRHFQRSDINFLGFPRTGESSKGRLRDYRVKYKLRSRKCLQQHEGIDALAPRFVFLRARRFTPTKCWRCVLDISSGHIAAGSRNSAWASRTLWNICDRKSHSTRREFLREILYKNIAIIAIQHSKIYFADSFGDFLHTVEWN